ncbi:MAG: PilZ domain-containing protein [Desulfatitalea sp.]|nr:PilZ domain-containing protein [Desulfatitalea sp.]
MTSAVESIEKQTLVTRLAVSIYKMDEQQLALLLEALEPLDGGGERGSSEEWFLRHPRSNSGIMRKQMVIARIFVLIQQMDKSTLLSRLGSMDTPQFHWVRQFPRLTCYLLVDFAARGKAYRSCIRDISANGVFIETTEKFEAGQEVALCFAFSEASETLPFKIKGRVARLYPDGIGVQYEPMTHYRRDILNTLIHKIC